MKRPDQIMCIHNLEENLSTSFIDRYFYFTGDKDLGKLKMKLGDLKKKLFDLKMQI